MTAAEDRGRTRKVRTSRRKNLYEAGIHLIPIELIEWDEEIQQRAAGLDLAVVHEYAGLLREYRVEAPGLPAAAGASPLPPIVVYGDGATKAWLADGFHRLGAAKQCDLGEILADIRMGTRRDAIKHAIGANAAHGLRRTNADKRRSVLTAMADEEWSAMSDRELARMCGVTHPFVGAIRKELRDPVPEPGPAPVLGLQAEVAEGDGADTSIPLPPGQKAAAEAEAAASEAVETVTAARGLPNDERAAFDAYWTPRPVADACVRWLRDRGLVASHGRAVEPAVGGGAWVDALHFYGWEVDRFDLDPQAPGLTLHRRRTEQQFVQNWLERTGHRPQGWDLVIGNRPWSDPIAEWVELSLERAPVVVFLERETVTGANEGQDRIAWWRTHRPSWIVKVAPRIKWEGPGARPVGDMVDAIMVVWERSPDTVTTRWDWIDWRNDAPGAP